MVKTGYAMFPTWASWQIDSFLSLDADQKQAVDQALNELHAWHRKTQLPQYAAMLQQFDDRLRISADADELGRMREKVQALWAPTARRLAPHMAELLVSLRPEQIDRLQRKFAESNRKMQADYLPSRGKTREEARAERVIKRAEFFLGDLTQAQLTVVKDGSAELPANEEAWMAEREARQRHLLALIEHLQKHRPSAAEATRLSREYLLTLWGSRDKARQARLDASVAASDRLSARILAMAEPVQRAHLSDKLRGFASDMTVLASATTAP